MRVLLFSLFLSSYCNAFDLSSYAGYSYFPETNICGAELFVSGNQLHLRSIVNTSYSDPATYLCAPKNECDGRMITYDCNGYECYSGTAKITLLESGDYIYQRNAASQAHFIKRSYAGGVTWTCN